MKAFTKRQRRLLLAGLFVGVCLLAAGLLGHYSRAAESQAVTMQGHSYEIRTGEPVIGAVLHLLTADETLLAELVTDGGEIVFDAELTAGETYILREVAAPPGYVLAEDIVFTVSEDGSIDEIVMEDDYTKVEIAKLDGRDHPLPGVPFEILDKDGAVVEEWITTDEPHWICAKLTAGETYTLHEVKAPDGYLAADDQTFTVSTDGSIDRLTVYNIRSDTPVTGDRSPVKWLVICCAVGIIISTTVELMVAAQKRHKKKGNACFQNQISRRKGK